MLFLLNDTVLDIKLDQYQPPLDPGRFAALSLNYVTQLGQEVFAEDPLLHRSDQERAKRLAALLYAKAPKVNAALFSAPAKGCRPDEVATKFANVGIDVMARLLTKAQQGELSPAAADREVWKRMAA